METQLYETWQIHNRIVLYLLVAIDEAGLAARLANKGRTVGQIFAHLHNNRLAWLESAAPTQMSNLAKLGKDTPLNQALLQQALLDSVQIIDQLLQKVVPAGRISGFKPHPTAFVAYLISHEAYHHGEIGLILSQSGRPLDKKVAYGLWEWGKR